MKCVYKYMCNIFLLLILVHLKRREKKKENKTNKKYLFPPHFPLLLPYPPHPCMSKRSFKSF